MRADCWVGVVLVATINEPGKFRSELPTCTDENASPFLQAAGGVHLPLLHPLLVCREFRLCKKKLFKMCMFYFHAHVSATKIFVCPSYDGTRQLTVYSNQVSNRPQYARVRFPHAWVAPTTHAHTQRTRTHIQSRHNHVPTLNRTNSGS